MDQRIFELKLSVEATSLYLLMVGLADGGASLSLQTVAPFWNGGEAELDAAFAELEARKVALAGAGGAWVINPPEQWR